MSFRNQPNNNIFKELFSYTTNNPNTANNNTALFENNREKELNIYYI